jgi:hypothetical protein
MIFNKIKQDMPFIRKDNFRLLFPEIQDNSYSQNIKYWIKNKNIIPLKRGLYIFSGYWDKCRLKDEYLYYLSSIIYFPSYISKETVLARYGMLTETVYGVSAVTNKTFRSFSNEISSFTYSKIKNDLFIGFNEAYFLNNKYYIASKSKALFDYLYFYKRKLTKINIKSVEELRINFDKMTQTDWKEFESYLDIAKSNKLNRMYKIIKNIYAAGTD